MASLAAPGESAAALDAVVTLLVATVSVNVAAKLVSPSHGFANFAPRRISRRMGGLIAGVVGVLLAVGGANTAPNGFGPFPAHGLIPLLKPLYSYSWAVGFVAGLVPHLFLAVPGRARSAARPPPSAPSLAAAQ